MFDKPAQSGRHRRRSRGQRALDRLAAGALLAAAGVMRLLPADWSNRLFGMLGRAAARLSGPSRRIARNLALTRPEAGPEAARALATQVGDNFGRVIGEYVRFDAFMRRPDRLRVEGAGRLRAAAAQGRGVVVATAHLGNWEAVRLAAREAGAPLGLLTRGFNNAEFERLALARTGLLGGPVLTKDPVSMMRMARALRRGGAMLVLLDQRIGRDPPLPFLGVDAPTNRSVIELALRVGAPVLTARARRRADGVSFDVVFEPPAPPGDVETVMRHVNDRMSAWIEETPGQWLWTHRRWRGRRGRPSAAVNRTL